MFFMKDDFIKRCVEQDIKTETARSKKINHPDFIYPIHVSESLSTLYHSFFSYLKQNHKIPRKIIELKFREMILNICADHNNSILKDVLFTLSDNVNGSIEPIMEEQYFYNLKIDEFARLCGKSISTFKREFKKAYNTTPGRWLLKKRLTLASNIMLSSDYSIQQISYECGFENDSHFNRSFKSQFGLTPKQWRDAKAKELL